MTPEQLDEIEKLAEAQEFLGAGSYALPLVKALREAQKERDEARAEVERLREVVRLAHAMTGRDVDWAAFPKEAAIALREIHKLTKDEP